MFTSVTKESRPVGNNSLSSANNNGQTSKSLTPQEEAIQSFSKKIVKARVFRGFYEERRYVEPVNGYRDIIILERHERDLETLLCDVKQHLIKFYSYKSQLWIGITTEMSLSKNLRQMALTTSIWTELEDIAFGQYWFLIKSLRFRDKEINLKVKIVRAIEPEFLHDTSCIRRLSSTTIATETPVTSRGVSRSSSSSNRNSITSPNTISALSSPSKVTNPVSTNDNLPEISNNLQENGLENSDVQASLDFIQIIQMWGFCIKRTIYDFMANDISKENLIAIVRFIGLLVFALFTLAVTATKFLGIFTLHFMHEFSRLTHALTPICIKIIDVINKLIGGFYILLAMIWNDMVTKRQQNVTQQPNNMAMKRIAYYVKPSESTRESPYNNKFKRNFEK